MSNLSSPSLLPYKSVAVALLFSVFLGPVGLLYSSLWGGFLMICMAFVALSNQWFYSVSFLWLMSSVWAVAAAEKYNKRIVINA